METGEVIVTKYTIRKEDCDTLGKILKGTDYTPERLVEERKITVDEDGYVIGLSLNNLEDTGNCTGTEGYDYLPGKKLDLPQENYRWIKELTKLEFLDLTAQYLGEKEVNYEFLRKLPIKELVLRWNELTKEDLHRLFEGIGDLSKLERLDLRDNRISPKDLMKELGYAIEETEKRIDKSTQCNITIFFGSITDFSEDKINLKMKIIKPEQYRSDEE